MQAHAMDPRGWSFPVARFFVDALRGKEYAAHHGNGTT